MATDPRLEYARLMMANSTPRMGAGGSLQERAARQYAELSSKKKTQPKTGGTSPGGWKGLVAAALDNPIARTALKPLSAIDYGRATVVSTLKELTDALDFNNDTKASWNDLTTQANRHIGFGDIIKENGGLGNKWLDRIAGFVGDVALDPTTYLTLGAGHLAGMTGRVGVAADIATRGAKNVAAGKITQEALDEIVQRAGKSGLGKLKNAERLEYGLPESGLRFMGKRIEGTERIAEAVGGKLAGFRTGVTDSRTWGRVFRDAEGNIRRAPDNLAEAYTKLATGRGAVSATQAASLISGVNAKASLGGEFAGIWGRVAHGLFSGERSAQRKVAVTNLVETGNLSDPLAAASAKFFEDTRLAHAAATGTEIGRRENYVPHMWSRFGRKVLNGDSKFAEDLRRVLSFTKQEVNELGYSMERKITAGTYEIGGKKVTFKTGTIDDINRTMQAAFPEIVGKQKVLIDDMPTIMGNYAKALGEDVGNKALLGKLKEMGVAGDKSIATHIVVDEAGTKAANAEAAKNFKISLEKGKEAYKIALKDAKSSLAAATKAIGDALKQRTAVLRSRNAQLNAQWEKIQNSIFNQTVDFDTSMQELNAVVFDLEDKLAQAQDVSQRLLKRYEDDIAQTGVDEKLLSKERLELRRQAKQRLDSAQERVVELQAHKDAYDELMSTVKSLKDDVDALSDVSIKNLPESVEPIIRTRTVAEQTAIDTAGLKGNEVVNQVVTMGTKGDKSFGLSKRLKIDMRSSSSVLRQTIDNVSNFIGEQYQVELGRLRNILDEVHGSVGALSDKAILREERRISALAENLRNEKAVLAGKIENNVSEQTIQRSRNRISALETQIEESYKSLQDRISVSNATGFDVRPTLSYSDSIPGTQREQALKQVANDVKNVKQSIYDDAVARGLSPRTAQLHADLFESTFNAMDVLIRANRGVPGSGAYVVSAQNRLMDTLKRTRIASDFESRLGAVMGELKRIGYTPTTIERPMIENLVMYEVLQSEKRILQTRQKNLLNSLEHYASKQNASIGSLKKTKGYLLAIDQAEKTWDFVKMYVKEFRDALDEVTEGRVFQVGEKETQQVSGKLASKRVYNAMLKDRDFMDSIALAITGDRAAAKALVISPEFKKIISQISGPLGPNAKKSWTDVIVKLQTARQFAGGKEARWIDNAAQSARREIDEITKQIDAIQQRASKLKPSGGAKPASKEALDAIARFRGLADDAQRKLDEFNRTVLKDLPDEESREAVRVARERLQSDVDVFEGAIEQINILGVVPKGPRLNPEAVINDVVRIPTSENSKKLADNWAKIAEMEAKASDILQNTGALADRVRDVPGRQSITTKAKNYIAVIDEELDIIAGRIKSGISDKAAVAEAKAYAAQLRQERKALVQAIDNATPLDERIASAAKQVEDIKAEVKGLTGPGSAELEMRAKRASLNARMAALAEQRTAREAQVAAEQAANDVLRAGLRDAYDASVSAAKDAAQAVDNARGEIQNLIPAIEEVMRALPKPSGVKSSGDVNAVFEWLADGYDLLDPEGLVQRMVDIPKDMTPDMLRPGGVLSAGVTNREMVAVFNSLPKDSTTRAVLALVYDAHVKSGKLLTLMGEREYETTMMKLAKEGQLFSVMKQVVKDGFEELASSGVFVPTEVAEIMKRVVSLDQSTGNKLLDAMNYYTDIWKAVKTTSPRFHIRNAMSATFMNYVFGVKTQNMKLGAKYFTEFERNPLNWLDNVDPKYRKYVKQALDVVFASGGGQYGEIDNAATAISQKGVFRYSRMKGTTVEGSVRMGHALEMVLPPELGGRGLGFDAAVGSVTKAHFNYSQLSKMDRKAKAFIPFWTFMSRNLPLQIEQMWLNPKAYAAYNSFVRNTRAEEEGEVVPQWVKEIGGFKLPFGEGLFATPDIGMNRVSQDIEQLRDPVRFAQNLNPVPKTLIELLAGKQFYKNIPIEGDQYVPLKGAKKALLPLLEIANLVERAPDGTPVISEKVDYGLTQLIPGLAESERLVAPSKKSYQEKLGQSRLTFFTGLPVTKVGPTQVLSEQLSEKREAQKKKTKAKNIAKAVTK